MASFRASLNLSSTSNKRYTDEVYFGGVDYANPRMNVQQGHAIDEINYVYREKAVQKRFGAIRGVTRKDTFYAFDIGYKEIVDTSKKYYGDSSNKEKVNSCIYGMWSYKGFMILNMGEYLFYVEERLLKDGIYTLVPIACNGVGYEVDSDGNGNTIYYSIKVGITSSAFEGNGKLYLLSGEYVWVLEVNDEGIFRLYSLTENGNPYVPTTTIGIVQNESEGYATRTTYESPNLLTPIRKNGFVGGIKNKDSKDTTFTYLLDKNATEIRNVHITTAGFPYSMRSTVAKKDMTDLAVLDGIDNLSYQGFAFPRMGDNGIANLVVNPTATGWSIDLRNFIVYGMNGDRLTYSTLDKTPPVEFQKGKSGGRMVPYVNEVGDMGVTAVATNAESTSSGKTSDDPAPYTEFSKYEDGKYYVAIFGKSTASGKDDIYNPYKKTKYFYTDEDGEKIETTDKTKATISEIPDSTVFKVSKGDDGVYRYSDFKVKPIHKSGSNVDIDYEYCNYYQLIVFARIDGEIRYASVTFQFVTYSACSTTIIGKTDPQDFAGNVPVEFKGGNYTSYPNFGILAMLGIDISNYMKEKGMLYDKAGRFLTEKAPGLLAYAFNEKEVTLVPRAVADGTSYVDYSKLNGTLRSVQYPFYNLKSTQKGYFLVDENEKSNNAAKIYGYVTMEQSDDGDYMTTGNVVLYENPAGEYEGQSNIECEFVAEGEENNKDDINKCTFGIMYGTQNYRNRLFVSGNPANPNCDWHSAEGAGNGDLDYFPSDSVCRYGESTPLAGYGIVSDGKLMAVKRYSAKEPTVYYRTATYAVKKDDYGKAVTDLAESGVYEESYPLTQTNSHIGALYHTMFTDFNGDSLFVDTDGRIVGMDNVGTTYDNQRIANSRTTLIDPRIKGKEKSRYLVSYGNDLYYFVDDMAYYCNYEDKYEWFPIDILSSKASEESETEMTICSCMHEGQVYFGTNLGGIYHFCEGSFEDVDTLVIEKGEICIDYEGDYINKCGLFITNPYLTERLKLGYNHIKYAGDSVLLGLAYETDKFEQTGDGEFKATFPANTIQPESEYYLTADSRVTFTLERSDDIDDFDGISEVYYLRNLTSAQLVIVKKLVSQKLPLRLFNKVTETDTLSISDSGAIYATSNDGMTYTKFAVGFNYGYIHLASRRPVKASYITAPYLTGSLGNRKTIDSYTIISDKGYQNEIYVKAITNNVALEELFNMGGQVDYSDLDYMKTDYTRYDLPHAQTLLGKFFGPFITLSINSPNAVNSVLTKINFLYHTAGKTYGKN